jgi:hypothetical protein
MWKKKKEGKKQKREMKFETTELLLWGRKRKFYGKKKKKTQMTIRSKESGVNLIMIRGVSHFDRLLVSSKVN